MCAVAELPARVIIKLDDDVLQDQALAQQNSLGEQSRHQFLAPVSTHCTSTLLDELP
jgi:hypothetical protein